MKHFLLIILLIFFSGLHSKAQSSKAREIVNLALKKHTFGKILERYEIKADYDKPGKAPAPLVQRDPLLELIDSIMVSLPDSEKNELIVARKHMFDDMEDFWAGQKETHFVYLTSGATAFIFQRPTPLRGGMDSTKMVYYFDKQHLLIESLTNNPIALLQLMVKDSTELHYSGPATIDSKDYFIIQAKMEGKWLDFHIDQKTYLLYRLTISQVDKRPLIGQGPVYYKDITIYENYQKSGGYMVPLAIEEVSSRSPVTRRKKLDWVSFNKRFSFSTFDPGPNYIERTKCKIDKIGEGLFVMERSSDYINTRSLLRVNQDSTIEMFGDLTNNDDFNKKELEAVKLQFKKYKISNIFNVKGLVGLVSLSCFFSEQIHISAPKEVGVFDGIKSSYILSEDSMRIAESALGLLTTFDSEFQNGFVNTFILNPVRGNDNLTVSYYLPKEKIIYFDGNPYSADNSTKNAYPREKLLYDIIQNRSLKVEKVVYSGSYLTNAPLFMTFKDFESRIKNTDFSIYDKVKR